MLLAGLPAIPPRGVTYRGRRLLEFDLDAALARRPRIVLVDELAHTNVPGSRHERRRSPPGPAFRLDAPPPFI